MVRERPSEPAPRLPDLRGLERPRLIAQFFNSHLVLRRGGSDFNDMAWVNMLLQYCETISNTLFVASRTVFAWGRRRTWQLAHARTLARTGACIRLVQCGQVTSSPASNHFFFFGPIPAGT